MLGHSWVPNTTTREIICRLTNSAALQMGGRHAHDRAQELRWVVWRTPSEIRQSSGQSLLWGHVEGRVGRITVTERRLHWKAWVPLCVGLVREHGWKRSRIHLVHGSLRLNTLLDTKYVKLLKRILEHAALSSRWERRA